MQEYDYTLKFLNDSHYLLGEGSSVKVFQRDNKTVIRLHKEIYSFDYYNFCLNNKINGFPDIISIEKFDNFYISVSKKYTSISDRYLSVDSSKLDHCIKIAFRYIMMDKSPTLIDNVFLKYEDVDNISSLRTAFRNFGIHKKSFPKYTVDDIDVDSTNVMMNGDEFIINDPFYVGDSYR